MTKQLGKLSNPDAAMSKNIALVLNWFKAACTRSLESPTVSILNVSSKRLPLDSETVQWTLLHLQTVVPRQTRAKTQPPREAAATAPSREPPQGDPQRTDELFNRIIALSENVLARDIDRERPNETAKKLSEVELCRLLGFCGLGWHEQHLLPPIWANIKKQPDRASREAVLSAFFADLARLDPSLRLYSNQAFFDDIVNHRFVPGDDYDTCHKGFSPLAFMPRTHAEVTEDNANADHYAEANIKTVSDVKKHRTKGPPPIPNNDAELLRLNTRDVTVLKAFFTEWSSLVQQETDLNDGLHDLQTDLFSRPESTRKMIPQLMWAKIKARRNFFLTTCTREMIDVPPERHPIIAKAKLNAHAVLFLSGTEITIAGVPNQWLDDSDKQGPTKKQKSSGSGQAGGSGSGPPRNDGRYGNGGTPFETNDSNRRPADQARRQVAGEFNNGPPAFAQSNEIKALLRKHRDVQLGMVAVAAGFPGGSKDLPTDGIPNNCCLLWLCFGKCGSDRCSRAHPTTVDNAAAKKLHTVLLPGIIKITNSDSLPPRTRYGNNRY
jgi:hypothetical protein